MTQRTVSIVGVGLMGAAIARTLGRSGYKVLAWNRTMEKALALVSEGVMPCGSIAEAIDAADLLIHVSSRCEDAFETLAGSHTRVAGKDILNLSSGTPKTVQRLAQSLEKSGARFASGTILCYPSDIGSPGAAILVGADDAFWTRNGDLIRSLAGGSSLLGTDQTLPHAVEAAIAGCFVQSAMGACLEAARFMTAHGLPLSMLQTLLPETLEAVRHQSELALQQIENADFATTEATIATYERSHAVFVEAFRDAGAPSDLLEATHRKLQRAIAAGDSGSSFAAIFQH